VSLRLIAAPLSLSRLSRRAPIRSGACARDIPEFRCWKDICHEPR